MNDEFYINYAEWHAVITGPCGIVLTSAYCQERIDSLGDAKDDSTKRFVELYGEVHRDKVVGWFRRAAST